MRKWRKKSAIKIATQGRQSEYGVLGYWLLASLFGALGTIAHYFSSLPYNLELG